MSIDEAIAKYKAITNTDAICPAHCNISCDKCVQESRQIAEWLEELKELREYFNSTEIGKYRFQKGYNKAIDDFVNACKENIMYKTFGLRECDIEKIAEQLKAGVKE